MSQIQKRSPLTNLVQRAVLDNGITLLVIENPTADIVASRIFIKAGTRWESKHQAGLSHLVSAVITKGTDTLSSLEIAEQVESVGASLSADTATDYLQMSLKTIGSDFAEIFNLTAKLLRSPAFPAAEVELERQITLQDIRSQQEHPSAIAFEQLRRAMYGRHPYGLSSLGTIESVSGLTREDLQNYHQSYFRPDNLVISIAGNLTFETARYLVEKALGDWEIPTNSILPINLSPIVCKPYQVVTPQETQQSMVMLGYLASSVKDKEYGALKVLNTYLGNGLSSRLFVELREKRGLAYEVSAFYPTRLDLSQFVVYLGTAPENTAIALEGLHHEIERLRTHQLTDSELQTCKNKLLGQYALGKQTNAQLAQVYGWYETLGLGIEFDTVFQELVNNVTVETAWETACQYFVEPYISLVGPAKFVENCQI
ncbi:M16 family metallopeptidase [Merismopedia glauca]|uniref:M16 family metallopeptidase n=1 Tax=Merismopedia glauca TaxID=292586 RepID=UPI001FE9FA67|nr:pitrilysin family protein [Merismopedia glauca]